MKASAAKANCHQENKLIFPEADGSLRALVLNSKSLKFMVVIKALAFSSRVYVCIREHLYVHMCAYVHVYTIPCGSTIHLGVCFPEVNMLMRAGNRTV